MKTLKDIEEVGEEAHTVSGTCYKEDLKQEAIKWVKLKLEYLETQPSVFKVQSINLKTGNIIFTGLSPEGNEQEEKAKGWIMGFIFFFNIEESDLE